MKAEEPSKYNPVPNRITPMINLLRKNSVELETDATVFNGCVIFTFPSGITPKSVLGVRPVTLLLVKK